MHLMQGTFSYLPPLTDEQIRLQVHYALDNGWAVSVEFSDDPHPRNFLWDMWALPMFDVRDARAVLQEVAHCREAHPDCYVRVNAYDRSLGRQTTALSFIVQRPAQERGFRLDREESHDRSVRYRLHPYALDRPAGERYSRR